MRDGRLEGIKAIIERQQRMLAERNSESFLLGAEYAGRCIGRDATARSLQSDSEPEAVTAETVPPVLKMQPT
jgi:hypothetical protein